MRNLTTVVFYFNLPSDIHDYKHPNFALKGISRPIFYSINRFALSRGFKQAITKLSLINIFGDIVPQIKHFDSVGRAKVGWV